VEGSQSLQRRNFEVSNIDAQKIEMFKKHTWDIGLELRGC
jgi:hypothetical protein